MLKPSVIVTTYNNPKSLRLALAGLERQTINDFQILVADDGSTKSTAEVISQAARRARRSIEHVWHPDKGFRKCRISNKAILAAEGDYLIFLDGDCIPFPTFVEAHLKSARRGRFVAGSKVFMSEKFTARVTLKDLESGRLDRPGMWWLESSKNLHRLILSRVPGIRCLLDLNRQTWSWRGDNSSTFADHLHAVGGFDERLTYGGEDKDLGLRLEGIGVRCLSRRYQIPVLHLEHDRPYVNMDEVYRNVAVRNESIANRHFCTEHGLNRHANCEE